MTTKKIPSGLIHKVPKAMKEVILSTPNLQNIWTEITPLARNEWICWIESAKKLETRDRRTKRMKEGLLAGKRRPCCWEGCSHR